MEIPIIGMDINFLFKD